MIWIFLICLLALVLKLKPNFYRILFYGRWEYIYNSLHIEYYWLRNRKRDLNPWEQIIKTEQHVSYFTFTSKKRRRKSL